MGFVVSANLPGNTTLLLCFLVWLAFYNFDKHIYRDVKKFNSEHTKFDICNKLRINSEDLSDVNMNSMMNSLLEIEEKINELEYNIPAKPFVEIEFGNPYYRPKRSIKSLLCSYGLSSELKKLKQKRDDLMDNFELLVKLSKDTKDITSTENTGPVTASSRLIWNVLV